MFFPVQGQSGSIRVILDLPNPAYAGLDEGPTVAYNPVLIEQIEQEGNRILVRPAILGERGHRGSIRAGGPIFHHRHSFFRKSVESQGG
jgi:hypothetical protein